MTLSLNDENIHSFAFSSVESERFDYIIFHSIYMCDPFLLLLLWYGFHYLVMLFVFCFILESHSVGSEGSSSLRRKIHSYEAILNQWSEKKQLYIEDSLDISDWVGHHTWHTFESFELTGLFKNIIQVFSLIFWICCILVLHKGRLCPIFLSLMFNLL